MRNFTQEEKAILKHVIEEGTNILQKVKDMKDGLREDVKSVAETLEIKPTLINKAIKVAHKMNLGEEKNKLSDVEDLLTVAGKKA
jgi:hypothetical protein